MAGKHITLELSAFFKSVLLYLLVNSLYLLKQLSYDCPLSLDISTFFTNIVDKFVKKLQKAKKYYENKKKWKLYLYLNNQCIKCLKIDKDFAPMNKFYVVKVKKMKHLIGTNKPTQMIFKSFKYKYTDEVKKTAHIEVIGYEGVGINE